MSNFKELVRIGKDAVTRFTPAGKSVTGFSAAFDNGWGDNKKTVWLDCNAWGERYGKVAEYLTKGTQIVVSGDIGTREYEGKTYVTLTVDDIKLIAKPKEQGNSASGRPQRAPSNPKASLDGEFQPDEIPFATNRGMY